MKMNLNQLLAEQKAKDAMRAEKDRKEDMRKAYTMAASGEEADREKDELKKESTIENEINKIIEENRSKNWDNLPYDQPEAFFQSISKVDYFAKKVIFERAAEQGLLSSQRMIELFSATNNPEIQMAILEAIPRFKGQSDEEKKKSMDFLFYVAGKYRDDENHWRKVDWLLAEGLVPDYMRHFLIGELGTIGDENLDYYPKAAIQGLVKMGTHSEEYLIRLLEDNFSRRKAEQERNWAGNNSEIFDEQEQEKFEEEDNDYSEEVVDERGFFVSFEDKTFWDARYFENAYIMSLLAQGRTRQGTKYLLDIAINDETLSQIYFRDICWYLMEMDKKSVEEIFDNYAVTEKINSEKVYRMFYLFTDSLGAERLRDKLNALILSNEISGDLETGEKLKKMRSYVTPNDDKIAITNLQDFYQKSIKFEEYKVNEKMNEREVELLESLLQKDQKALEMGCGAGRLIKELVKDGFDISGFDFTGRHVEITKEEIEKSGQEAKVFQGDWHHNAIQDESLEVVYSLGRNILHDYSIVDQVQLFREARRMLKNGGRFIFDIPSREKATPIELQKVLQELRQRQQGKNAEEKNQIETEILSRYNGYERLVLKYGIEMDKRGIHNFRFGSIYDSPDNINFATRFAYGQEDIEELARLSGFRIEKVEKRTLETGQGDENLYFVLEKIA